MDRDRLQLIMYYRYIRLLQVSCVRDRTATGKLHRHLKGLHLNMKEHHFLGEDPIVLEILLIVV